MAALTLNNELSGNNVRAVIKIEDRLSVRQSFEDLFLIDLLFLVENRIILQ